MAVEAPQSPQASVDDGDASQRAAIAKAADPDRQRLSPEDEHGALSFLLGARQPLLYDVRTTYATPTGDKPLTFVVKQMDGRKIDEIETRHRNQTSGLLDQLSADTELVANACVEIVDDTGERTSPVSEQFRTTNPQQPPLASTAQALEVRFREQMGVLSGVAREVRRVSGWAPDRVQTAERRLVEASGNS